MPSESKLEAARHEIIDKALDKISEFNCKSKFLELKKVVNVFYVY